MYQGHIKFLNKYNDSPAVFFELPWSIWRNASTSAVFKQNISQEVYLVLYYINLYINYNNILIYIYINYIFKYIQTENSCFIL